MRYNENGLFPALEAALKAASEPLDCLITEVGSVVTIETPHLVIQIRQKN